MVEQLDEHYGYLSDRVKLERYDAAIRQVVQPQHVVMDLGCGSGLLGLMALRAGVRKVIFVEEGAIIEVARRTVFDAGFSDKAEFHRRNSFELSLAERVDVVLCDHVGYFGFDYGILALLADARQRFLKPDGIVMPVEVDLRLAPVETGDGRNQVSRWRDGSVPDDFAWVGQSAANSKLGINAAAQDLLAESVQLATFRLGTEAQAYLSWQAEFSCVRDGTLDGLLGWFDCRLVGDIGMTNSPIVNGGLSRPQAFMPLECPIAVRAGEPINATVMARHLDNILAWTIELPQQDELISLTTFNGLLLDNEALNRSHPDRVARLNDRGHARQVIHSFCDGRNTVAQIEALVRRDHPDLFPTAAAAEKMVRHVLASDTDE